MAPIAARVMLHGIGLVLFLTINHASSNQFAGILSNLYEKAALEKRPLILVLDNDKALTPKPLELTTRRPFHSIKKHTPSMSVYNGQKLPLSLLQHLQKQKSKIQAGKSLISSIFGNQKLRKGKKTLPYQINRIDWDKIRDQSDEYHSLRVLIKKNTNKQGIRTQSGIDKRALRSSIINNVLRQSNGNCGVVEDNCDVKEDSCEVKVECEEPKNSDECTFSDTCAEDTQISTKGVLLENSCENTKYCRK